MLSSNHQFRSSSQTKTTTTSQTTPTPPPHRPSLKLKDDAARYQLAIARAKAIHARRVRLLACGYARDEPGVDDGYTGQHFTSLQ